MVYMSERIINISELEELIRNARLNFEVLEDELKKDVPSQALINGTSQIVKESLEKAENFELHIEQRKCEFKASHENPKCLENPVEVHNEECDTVNTCILHTGHPYAT